MDFVELLARWATGVLVYLGCVLVAVKYLKRLGRYYPR